MDANKMILRELKRKHMTGRHLAQKLAIAPSAVHSILNRSTLQVKKLFEVSQALEYNFFREIAELLPYSEPKDKLDTEAMMAPLLEQIKNLQMENSILRQTLKDITSR